MIKHHGASLKTIGGPGVSCDNFVSVQYHVSVMNTYPEVFLIIRKLSSFDLIFKSDVLCSYY